MSNREKYHDGRFSSNGFSPSRVQEQKHYQEEDEINLKQLLYALWNRKWLVIGSIVLFGLLAGLVGLFTTPIYESDGSILINQPQNNFSGLSLGGGSGLSDILSSSYGIGTGSTLDNELEILRTRRLTNDIADSLINVRIMPNGRQYPIISRGYPDDSTIIGADTVAARLREKLVFQKVETNANVIDVLYESPSPVEAGQIVNIALSQYRQLSSAQTQESASSAGAFLQNEQQRIKEKLRASEEELREFMNNSDLIEVDAQTQELIQQMADLEARRQEARALLVAANSGIERYQNELNTIKPGLAEQYSEAVGPDISRLQYAKSELEVQKQQLLANNPGLEPTSPQLEEINRKIESYKSRIRDLTEKLINENDRYLSFLGGEGIAASVSEINQKLIELQVQKSQSQSQIDVITAQLKQQQEFFNNLPDNIIKLARLKRDVKINEEMFLAVTQQQAQTSLWEQSQYGLGRVIDDGYIPKEPVSPNIPLYIFIGFILGGVLSIGYLTFGQVFSSTINNRNKMKSYGEPLLSVIPFLEDYQSNERYMNDEGMGSLDKEPQVIEPYHRLANNIIYSKLNTNPKSIVITSAKNREGKTTTTVNLGVAMASAGFSVLLIDADFRNPKLHSFFGIDKSPGISDFLTDNIEKKNIIKHTPVEGLSILANGNKSSGPAYYVQNHKFIKLLEDVKNEFDYILIDTSPFGIYSDASALINYADGVIPIAMFNETTGPEFSSTLKQINQLDSDITGTVLNGFVLHKSQDGAPFGDDKTIQAKYGSGINSKKATTQ